MISVFFINVIYLKVVHCALKVHMNLHMNLFLTMKVQLKVSMGWDPSCICSLLPNIR